MKKIALLGCIILTSFLLPGLSSSHQVEVGGKKYQFSEIVSKTVLEISESGSPYVKNPFDRKTVKMYFAPRGLWEDYDKSLADKVWSVGNHLIFKTSTAQDGDPMYTIQEVLIGGIETKFGKVYFEIHGFSYRSYPRAAALFEIHKTIFEAAEKQKMEGVTCIEMVGNFYLSVIIQEKNVKFLGQIEVRFIFDPHSAKIVQCKDIK